MILMTKKQNIMEIPRRFQVLLIISISSYLLLSLYELVIVTICTFTKSHFNVDENLQIYYISDDKMAYDNI